MTAPTWHPDEMADEDPAEAKPAQKGGTTYGTRPHSPWRIPDEESIGLYPGLVVHDGRQSGSITIGRSRLPMSCFIHTALRDGWDDVEANWSPTHEYGWDADDQSEFLYHLLECRGELARLLLVLADVERIEAEQEANYFTEVAPEGGVIDISPGTAIGDSMPGPWWEVPELRGQVVEQLTRCVVALTDDRRGMPADE